MKNKEIKNTNIPLVKMENIDKYYGKVHALKGVNLEVFPGEVVGLIGDNGAGKSTLIKILSGVFPKNAGKIYWKGEEVNILSVKTARKLGIETVYQDRAVIGCMSVAQNIFMGREPVISIGFIKRLNKKKMREDAIKLSKKLKLNIPSPDQEVRFCSGGEMQGVAISRAMHFQASLVILDEPTTALAVSGVKQVLNFIEHLRNSGIACLFVSHNLYDVHAAADRIVVMLRGKIVSTVKKEDVSVDEMINIQLDTENKKG
jgi:simple sugar transport system ATP-binding protein